MLKKLLLVDDDPDECHLFREILADIDPAISCYYAYNGKDALHKLHHQEILLPDLFFVDIHMPEMNGWELLQLIRENELYQLIPVIIYSTSSRTEDIERAHQMGAGYVTKPARVEELQEKLLQLYNESLASLLQLPEQQ